MNSFESELVVELYANNQWTRQADFPGEKSFSEFSVASLEDRLYVFGKLNIHLIKVGFIFHKFMIFRYLMVNMNFQAATAEMQDHKNQFMWERKQNEDSNGPPLQIFSNQDKVIAP